MFILRFCENVTQYTQNETKEKLIVGLILISDLSLIIT